MTKKSEKYLINAIIVRENEEKCAEFEALDYKKTTNRYSQEINDTIKRGFSDT